MKKIFLLILLILITGGLLIIRWSTTDNETISSLPDDKSPNQIELCEESAKNLFKELQSNKEIGWKLYRGQYSSHWNEHLSKCFLFATATPGISSSINYVKMLYDASNIVEYGTYIFYSPGGDASSKLECQIYWDSNISSMKKCKTETEFNNYAAIYMESPIEPFFDHDSSSD